MVLHTLSRFVFLRISYSDFCISEFLILVYIFQKSLSEFEYFRIPYPGLYFTELLSWFVCNRIKKRFSKISNSLFHCKSILTTFHFFISDNLRAVFYFYKLNKLPIFVIVSVNSIRNCFLFDRCKIVYEETSFIK